MIVDLKNRWSCCRRSCIMMGHQLIALDTGKNEGRCSERMNRKLHTKAKVIENRRGGYQLTFSERTGLKFACPRLDAIIPPRSVEKHAYREQLVEASHKKRLLANMWQRIVSRRHRTPLVGQVTCCLLSRNSAWRLIERLSTRFCILHIMQLPV